jgi:hypothetical protein
MRLISACILAGAIATSACDRAQLSAVVGGDPGNAATAGSAVASGVREITLPAGTRLPITLDTTVGSDISHVEESVAAYLTTPIVIHGQTVLAAGSRVSGSVIDATRSGRVKGRAHVAIRFDSISPAGPGAESSRYRIETAAIGRSAESTKKKDAMMIGAPAAGGAVIGGLAGGGKGALIGAAVGGGAGTAVVLSTRGNEVRLTKGSALTLRLSEPLTVKVRG